MAELDNGFLVSVFYSLQKSIKKNNAENPLGTHCQYILTKLIEYHYCALHHNVTTELGIFLVYNVNCMSIYHNLFTTPLLESNPKSMLLKEPCCNQAKT